MAENFGVSILIKVIDQTSATIKKITHSLNNLNNPLDHLVEKFHAIHAALAVGIAAGFEVFVHKALHAVEKLEEMQHTLELITENGEEAKRVIEGIDKLTIKIKLPFDDIESATQALLKFGVSTKKILPTVEMLGQISIGSRMNLTDLAKVYGRTIQYGVIRPRVFDELIRNQVPIIQTLMKYSHLSRDAVIKLGRSGKLNANILIQAFQKMTSEGGIFYNQSEKASNELEHVFNNLSNALKFLYRSIGETIVETFHLKEVLTVVAEKIFHMAEGLNKFREAHPVITKIVMVLSVLAAVIVPLSVGLGILGWAIGGAISGFSALLGILGVISAPVWIVIGVIGALTAAISALVIWWPEVKAFFQGIGDSIKNFALPYIDALITKFNSLKDTVSDIFKGISWGNLNPLVNPYQMQMPDMSALKVNPLNIANPDVSALKINPLTSEKSQTDVNIKLTAPDGMSAKVSTIRNKGSSKVNFMSESYLGNTQMIPGVR